MSKEEYTKKYGNLYYDKVGSERTKTKANERIKRIRASGYAARIEPVVTYVIYKSKKPIR